MPLTCRVLFALALIATCVSAGGEPTRAAIRGDGSLLIDGRAVFPVGIHSEALDSIPLIAAAGFDLISGSGEWGPEHYASANEFGMAILGGHYVWATFASFRTGGGIELKPSEDAGIHNVINNARDQGRRRPLETLAAFDHLPGVIGWRINEEPEGKLVEYMEYGYEVFKSHSPAHIVVTLSCDPRWFHAFRNTCDVLIYNNFPFRGSHKSRGSLLETYTGIKRAVEVMGGKAVWVMPQLYPPSYWSLDPQDNVTLTDMRLQSYAGLIAGAKGVVMYDYTMFIRVRERDDTGERRLRGADEETMAARWSNVKSLVSELKELGPIICDGRLTEDLRIRWLSPGANGPGPQMTRELDLYGTKYLLVANTLDVPIQGRLYGINGGNPHAWDTRVWQGGEGLSAGNPEEREVEITVGPRAAGVFVLTRRPVHAPAEEG